MHEERAGGQGSGSPAMVKYRIRAFVNADGGAAAASVATDRDMDGYESFVAFSQRSSAHAERTGEKSDSACERTLSNVHERTLAFPVVLVR